MSNVNMWEIENSCYCEEIQVICGVDEAGRGPLAGPVCAAAVILPKDLELPGLTDSKKLKRRSVSFANFTSMLWKPKRRRKNLNKRK